MINYGSGPHNKKNVNEKIISYFTFHSGQKSSAINVTLKEAKKQDRKLDSTERRSQTVTKTLLFVTRRKTSDVVPLAFHAS